MPVKDLGDLAEELVKLKASVIKITAQQTLGGAAAGQVDELRKANEDLRADLAIARQKAVVAESKATELEERLDEVETMLGRPGATVHASARSKSLDTIGKLGVALGALARSQTYRNRSPLENMSDMGFPQVAAEFASAEKTLNTSNAIAGGIVVPQEMSSDFIELLRPSVGFLRGKPRRLPMPTGNVTIPAAATGAQAAYTTEGEPALRTEQTFAEVKLAAKKLAAVLPATNELLNWSLPAAQQFVTTDLVAAMAQTMDSALFTGDGLQGRPLGIFNNAGVFSANATNSTAPNLAQVDGDARKCINALVKSNVPLAGAAWIGHPVQWGYLQDLRDGNGNLAFPSLQGANPTWKGFPVIQTTNLSITGGAGSNEGTIALVAWPHVILGEAGPLQLAASSEAMIEIGGGQYISMFHRGMTAILAVAQHDVALRHPEAVSVLKAVKWGNG